MYIYIHRSAAAGPGDGAASDDLRIPRFLVNDSCYSSDYILCSNGRFSQIRVCWLSRNIAAALSVAGCGGLRSVAQGWNKCHNPDFLRFSKDWFWVE